MAIDISELTHTKTADAALPELQPPRTERLRASAAWGPPGTGKAPRREASALRLLGIATVLGLLAAPAGGGEPAITDGMSGIPAPVARQMRVHKIDPRDVSFYVRDTAGSEPLLAFNARVARNPASSIKLLTTAAGLDILGPGYRWRTRAYITGGIEAGRLDGDLIIKGSGDPAFSAQDLWRLLWGVRERGIASIGGDLVLDATYFEPPGRGRGDFDGSAASVYNALPHALSVNFQATRVHMLRSGDGIRVFTDPPLANLEVDNRLRLVKAPCQRKYHKPALLVDERTESATLRLTGTFADSCGESDYARLVLSPGEHAAGAALALWQAMQGSIEGQVRDGVLPQGARLLYTLESQPLEDAVRLINKKSNNLMSRTLFLTLGAEQMGAPGTLEKARLTVSGWLEERGLDFPELFLDNGSGLSRDTRISAESMARLLGYAYGAPIMPQLLSSLSIAGVDGTMRKRFNTGPIKGRAQIKTGTLRGATAAAGFVLDRDGRRWIVVSLINNPRLQAWRGKGIENTLIQWIYEEAGDGASASAASPERPAAWYLERAQAAGGRGSS
jgi:D-alanyl-D-alanine carboxypeptidase/D-alanyl-D-alanine-endopeptidase (penicillin-binding protein 4)